MLKSSVGVGSGLEIGRIIQDLIEAERSPEESKLSAREKTDHSKITAYSKIKLALEEFQNSMSKLKYSTAFNTRAVNIVNDATASSTTTYFTADVANSAVLGDFTVEIDQLAQSHKLMKIFNSADTVVGNGTLNITVGSGQPVNQTFSFPINADYNNNTVSGIKSAINAAGIQFGVSASLMNVDAGVALVISAHDPGVASTLDITVTNDSDGNDLDDSGLSQLITANMTQLSAPQDAIIKVNDEQVTVSSNDINTVLEGVTLHLRAAEVGKKHTITIAEDHSKTMDIIKDFVDKYNTVVRVFYKATRTGKIDAKKHAIKDNAHKDRRLDAILKDFNKQDIVYDPKKKGPLLHDPIIMNLQNTLRSSLNTVVSDPSLADPSRVISLSLIGISTNWKTGKLEINEEVTQAAIASRPDSISNLFTNANNGIAVSSYNALYPYTTFDGTIATQTNNLIQDLETVADEREKLKEKFSAKEAQMTQQYARLDALLGKLKVVGDALQRDLKAASVKPLAYKDD